MYSWLFQLYFHKKALKRSHSNGCFFSCSLQSWRSVTEPVSFSILIQCYLQGIVVVGTPQPQRGCPCLLLGHRKILFSLSSHCMNYMSCLEPAVFMNSQMGKLDLWPHPCCGAHHPPVAEDCQEIRLSGAQFLLIDIWNKKELQHQQMNKTHRLVGQKLQSVAFPTCFPLSGRWSGREKA